jgi:hypothetical protein
VVEESRVLPSWNGSRQDRLSGLMVQKSGLGLGSLEDSVPVRYLGPPDQVGGAERWAELGSLEDSVPFRCPCPPDQVGGALRPWWLFDEGCALLMRSELSAKMGPLRWTVDNPPPTCGR